MKKVLGCIRRADQDFHLISPGDRVLIGVSGGKDSLLLLEAMSIYRHIRHDDFEIEAAMLTMGKTQPDTSAIKALCEKLHVALTVRYTELYQILFDIRKESNPCALCAKIRRGMLCDLAKELHCNKLALGHHRDDALETLLMSLIFEGRIHTFHPKSHMAKTNITVIRPMSYLPEKHIIHMAKVLELPVLKNPCIANGHTAREDMKDLLDALCRKYPTARERMLDALCNEQQYSLWNKETEEITETI